MPNLKHENQLFNTDTEKPELFRLILQKTFSGTQNTEIYDNELKQQTERMVEDYLINNKKTFASFKPKDVIKKMPKHSALGLDGIHNLMLKNLPRNIEYLILDLVNLSFQTNSLAPIWKKVSITMIPKTIINRNYPKHYRPISLLSCLGKLIERVIHKRLYNLNESKELLTFHQSGFRQKKRAADSLTFLTQKIQENFNKRSKVGTLFFVISKAFDDVWQKGLIAKIIKLKLPDSFVN